VKVGKKYAVHILPANSYLSETLEGASTSIEYELLPAGFDQGAWAESIHNRRRGPCTEERYFDGLSLRDRWTESYSYKEYSYTE
jgi:hypothetical protein